MTLFSIKQLGRIGVSSEKALLQQHNSKDDPTTIAQAIRMEVLSAAHMGRALVHRSQILEAWTLARFRSPAQIAPVLAPTQTRLVQTFFRLPFVERASRAKCESNRMCSKDSSLSPGVRSTAV